MSDIDADRDASLETAPLDEDSHMGEEAKTQQEAIGGATRTSVAGSRADVLEAKPRRITDEGNCELTIGRVDLLCAGHPITAELERRPAILMLFHGRWDAPNGPEAVMDGHTLLGIELNFRSRTSSSSTQRPPASCARRSEKPFPSATGSC